MGEIALREKYGNQSLLGEYQGETRRIKVTEDGRMMTNLSEASDLKLLKSIKITFDTTRNKVLFNEKFAQITIANIDGAFTLFLDESDDEKAMTINQQMNITVLAQKFYISNQVQSGRGVELWLWGV